MGQKVNPILFRITGGTSEWFCDWYAKDKKTYANNVFEDLVIIQYLEKSEFSQYIGDVKVERKSSVPHVVIKTPRSAAIISKKGKGLETIQSDLKKLLKKEMR